MRNEENASLLTVENRTVSYAAGPLLFADAPGVGYNELVDVVDPSGTIRRGQVLAIDGDRVVVQVLAGTAGLNLPDTIVRTRGEVARTAVGLDLIGRILDGSGRPIDALAEVGAVREVARMRSWPEVEASERGEALIERIQRELEEL